MTATSNKTEGVGGKVRRLSVVKRNAARLAAMQTLYQYRYADDKASDMAAAMARYVADFLPGLLAELGLANLNTAHYEALLLGVESDREALDGVIAKHLAVDWRLERLPAIDLDTLRLAAYELRGMPDIPARAIIAEYAAIAEEAWATDPTYITAILDKIAHAARGEEMAGGNAGEKAGQKIG